MKQLNIKHINNLHSDALRALDFYDQELNILQNRLDEIAEDNTDDEILADVDHFQNQVVIHQRYISELRYRFHQNLKNIEDQVVHMAGFAEEDSISENEIIYEQFITEEKMFNALRHEFYRFAAKWM